MTLVNQDFGSSHLISLQRPSSATEESGESNMPQISSVSAKKLSVGNEDFASIIRIKQKVMIVQNVTGDMLIINKSVMSALKTLICFLKSYHKDKKE